ncbi:hypothetical protein BJY16_000131 [Actinoplanes octamycinicus]|uniref:MmpS family membrane protein n=1 Tax=Actinoplanes octamycinicus TaxID=135948 RepID=A0A7W7GQZ9_9ACTN|nr:hypothetical protein [Actinoplanes octamycinicus]MBB4736672.1 hypothetical protein [Actinoplanes octamycinicus]GIE60440.1 hypothetical protein Aoc01nite_58420 [Actinoplanes octamycinicus]
MRRQIELAVVAVVAAVVGALIHHIAYRWPGAHSETISIPAATFRISGGPVSISGGGIEIDDSPMPIVFEVTGTGEADVTYSPGPNGTTAYARVKTPWKETVMVPGNIPARDITLLAISASARADAEITCRIGVAGTEFAGVAMAEDTGYGPHAAADCK